MKKLSGVVDNEVVKNTKFNTLKTKVIDLENKIPDATTLIYINQYKTDTQNLENKIVDVEKNIADISGLVTTTGLNTKISEVENEIPDTSSLVITTVLQTEISEVENKFPDHAEYITTPEFNKVTENFAARLKQAPVNKTYFDNKLICLKRKLTSNKTKYLQVHKQLNNLKTKDCHYFGGRIYFTSNDGSQNRLIEEHFMI